MQPEGLRGCEGKDEQKIKKRTPYAQEGRPESECKNLEIQGEPVSRTERYVYGKGQVGTEMARRRWP